MTKICLSILALAAISSAAYAREPDGGADNPIRWNKSTITMDSPLAVKKEDRGSTNYERMEYIFEGNQKGSH